MITIAQIKGYGNKLMSLIPEIKKVILVVSDSQLVEMMNDISDSENLILVAFIPSHQSDGSDVDNVQNRNSTLWLILNKIDRNEGHDAIMDSFEKTQPTALAIQKQMLLDKSNSSGTCSLMRQLIVNSINIDPVWALAGCDGYEINYQLTTPIF
jgi:hypothetical protein